MRLESALYILTGDSCPICVTASDSRRIIEGRDGGLYSNLAGIHSFNLITERS